MIRPNSDRVRCQIRSEGGNSFWNLGGIDWAALRVVLPDSSDDRWVKWNGRIWLRKCEGRTMSEIGGYQFAEALGLPVQPWLSFVEVVTDARKRRTIQTVLLVECLPGVERTPSLFELPDPQADLLAIGTIWAFFARGEGEDPIWGCSRDHRPRLLDLDGFGPYFRTPIRSTRCGDYRADSKRVIERVMDEVARAGNLDRVTEMLRSRATVIRAAFDFSGHPKASCIEQILEKCMSDRFDRLCGVLGVLNSGERD